MFRDKRGVSPVVATVLLLVLTIVIGGVVFSVVIPFVNDKLKDSKECLDLLGGVEFAESKFNCYKTTPPSETGFSVKISKDGISGVKISLIDENENSDVFEIKDGTTSDSLRMVGDDGLYGSSLEFPDAFGQRTYVTKNDYVRAEISALSKSGEVCAVADVIEFEPCASGVNL